MFPDWSLLRPASTILATDLAVGAHARPVEELAQARRRTTVGSASPLAWPTASQHGRSLGPLLPPARLACRPLTMAASDASSLARHTAASVPHNTRLHLSVCWRSNGP
jgi:hypothetical protein